MRGNHGKHWGTATKDQLNALTLKMYLIHINTSIKADFS